MISTGGAAESSSIAELLGVSVELTDNGLLLALNGELDASGVDALSATLADAVVIHSRVTVDLANVSFLDSSGIRCLITAAKHGEASGCTVVVQRPTEAVLRVLQICGVDEELLHPSKRDA